MFCKQCGSEIKDGAAFCPSCGAQQTPAQNVEQDSEKTVGVFSAVPGVQPAAEPSAVPVDQTPVQPVQQYAQPQNAYDPNAGAAHNGKVGFIQAITLLFKNYFNFNGRASKSEYWWAFLFNIIVSTLAGALSTVIPPLGGLISLALMIPGISLAVRRLHDVGKPGTWWFIGLIPIVGGIILLILFLKDSEGDNQWGPGPMDAGFAGAQYAAAVNAAPANKVVTDNDIYAMAQTHEPVNLNDPSAKQYLDAALAKIVPTYTGIENVAGAMMLCDPQNIKANIAATDTDTLFVVFKALGYYIGQGCDASVLGMVQQNVLSTLKTRI